MKEKIMSNDGYYIHLNNVAPEVEQEPWEQLDQVIRKWATLSGFEKDQSDYQKMKELYQ
jgi:hypothetical protein